MLRITGSQKEGLKARRGNHAFWSVLQQGVDGNALGQGLLPVALGKHLGDALADLLSLRRELHVCLPALLLHWV